MNGKQNILIITGNNELLKIHYKNAEILKKNNVNIISAETFEEEELQNILNFEKRLMQVINETFVQTIQHILIDFELKNFRDMLNISGKYDFKYYLLTDENYKMIKVSNLTQIAYAQSNPYVNFGIMVIDQNKITHLNNFGVTLKRSKAKTNRDILFHTLAIINHFDDNENAVAFETKTFHSNLNNIDINEFSLDLYCRLKWALSNLVNYTLRYIGYRKNWSASIHFDSKFIRIANRKGSFFADPFVLIDNNKKYIFCEEFVYRKRKGVISAAEIKNTEISSFKKILEINNHLSYPFSFYHEGNYYMIPESSGLKEISLYKSLDPLSGWKKICTLVRNISAVDTNVFYRDGYWFLITCSSFLVPENRNNEMNIYYSNDLESSDWESHPLNPISLNAKFTRNGGIIFDGNDLYRVVQNRNLFDYGNSVHIRRILDVSNRNYKEIPDKEITRRFENLTGKNSHHIHYSNGLMVFDNHTKLIDFKQSWIWLAVVKKFLQFFYKNK